MLALPIFTASRPATIVGADELNVCVQDGNRWTLIAINTNYLLLSSSEPFDSVNFFIIPRFSPLSSAFFSPFSKELVTRTGFEPMLMA